MAPTTQNQRLVIQSQISNVGIRSGKKIIISTAVRSVHYESFEFSDGIVEPILVHLADHDVFSEGCAVGMLASHLTKDIAGSFELLVLHELFRFLQL